MSSITRPHALGPAGLCGRCARARRVISGRGSIFLRCAGHDQDASLPKYPPLPRLACHGFEERTEVNGERRD